MVPQGAIVQYLVRRNKLTQQSPTKTLITLELLALVVGLLACSQTRTTKLEPPSKRRGEPFSGSAILISIYEFECPVKLPRKWFNDLDL